MKKTLTILITLFFLACIKDSTTKKTSNLFDFYNFLICHMKYKGLKNRIIKPGIAFFFVFKHFYIGNNFYLIYKKNREIILVIKSIYLKKKSRQDRQDIENH